MFPRFFWFLLPIYFLATPAYSKDKLSCALIKNDANGYYVSKSALSVKVPKGSVLKLVGKSKKGQYLKLEIYEKPIWLHKKHVKLLKESECQSQVQSQIKSNNTHLYFMVGYSLNASTESFDELKTNIPDASNVSSLPNPIVTSIDKGSGYIFGVCHDRALNIFFLTFCGAYRSETFKVNTRPNPTPPSDSATLDELDTKVLTYDLQSLNASFLFNYYHDLQVHSRIGLGLGFSSDYYFQEKPTFEYFTGTVVKGELNVIETGPNGFYTLPILQASYDYKVQKMDEVQIYGAVFEFRTTGEISLRLRFGF